MTLTEYQSVDGPRYLAIMQDITEREKAEQFKQELLAMVSHDLRSPLTSVQGVMTLLAKGMYGQLTETGNKRVQVAEQSLARLIHLVDDILDLERMEAGKLQFNLERVPLSSIIDRSIEAVYDFAQQSHIRIDAAPTEILMDVDEDRLTQVVVNLLSNAVKFSPKNSIITVETERIADLVEVRVNDQGPGIPAEQQEGIFQRFHQVDGVVTTQKGTGLGLAICKAIIEGHEGSIGVRSEVGKGSSFWIRIPLNPQDKGELINTAEQKVSKVALP
jgi:signal transduction histidine kinase